MSFGGASSRPEVVTAGPDESHGGIWWLPTRGRWRRRLLGRGLLTGAGEAVGRRSGAVAVPRRRGGGRAPRPNAARSPAPRGAVAAPTIRRGAGTVRAEEHVRTVRADGLSARRRGPAAPRARTARGTGAVGSASAH